MRGVADGVCDGVQDSVLRWVGLRVFDILILILFFMFMLSPLISFFFFFLNNPAPPEISPLPLPDALPIPPDGRIFDHMTFEELNLAPAILKAVLEEGYENPTPIQAQAIPAVLAGHDLQGRSEEHTSELQSPCNLVCRLLLEKKKNKKQMRPPYLPDSVHCALSLEASVKECARLDTCC